jgi:hypothetical protein
MTLGFNVSTVNGDTFTYVPTYLSFVKFWLWQTTRVTRWVWEIIAQNAAQPNFVKINA